MKKSRLIIVVILMLSIFSSSSYSGWRSFVNRVTRRRSSSRAKLDTKTIVKGLKEALRIGTEKAVKIVSKKNGYFGNRLIKILLPKKLKKVAKFCRKIGLRRYVNDLILKMNRAAERASRKAVRIFIKAILSMSVRDAKNILRGKNDAATRYFERKTRRTLYREFHPVIKRALVAVGAIKVYKFVLKRYNKIRWFKKVRYDLDVYVTNKALDGLFKMLAKEEYKIRKYPAFRVTKLLAKVFHKIEKLVR